MQHHVVVIGLAWNFKISSKGIKQCKLQFEILDLMFLNIGF